jgi:hypothetical protein
MASFSALTADQQGQVLAFMTLLRPNCGELARACNHGSAMDSVWQTTVSALVTSLDAGTAIPDDTGLAGAVTLVREDVLGLMTAIEALLSSANTSAARAEYIKAAGIVNTVG